MKILLVGASGLVGQGVLKVLLQDAERPGVTLLVRRRSPEVPQGVRVLQVPELCDKALEGLNLGGIDACLYCAGPLPVLLSEAAYREATVATLECVSRAFARTNPRGRMIYVSGAGADIRSRLMPLRIKGEAEQVPGRFALATTVLRPGAIRPVQGERSPHRARRALYALAGPVLSVAVRLMPGSFTTSAAVGRCMLAMARAETSGTGMVVVENRQINTFAAT